MVKTPTTAPHPDNLVLARLDAMRGENQALYDMVKRVVELVGRQTEEAAGVRTDLAAIRADLAHIKSDIVHLENQNISRHGEAINHLRRLDDLDKMTRGTTRMAAELLAHLRIIGEALAAAG